MNRAVRRRGGADDPADREPHTATVFPDEVREVVDAAEVQFGESYDWRGATPPARCPGLSEGDDGEPAGETFEWALATDDCGDCTFTRRRAGRGLHGPRRSPAHHLSNLPVQRRARRDEPADGRGGRRRGCRPRPRVRGARPRYLTRGRRGAGRGAQKARAVRELEEAIGVRDGYDPTAGERSDGDVVVFDSEGAKAADGTPIDGD